MSANGAFQSPFANIDFSKFSSSFKVPTVDMTSAIDTGHKNFAAMTLMSTAAFEAIMAIVQRQGTMIRAAIEEATMHSSDMLAAGTIEEKAAKQIDFAKKSYEAAIAHSKDLAELYAKSQAEALATIKDRIAARSDEIKIAIAK